MHFVFHLEDPSGEKLLECILPNIIGDSTFQVIGYRGAGSLHLKKLNMGSPRKGLTFARGAWKRGLLDELPGKLRAYGKEFATYGPDFSAVFILVCDLDDKNYDEFIAELNTVLDACNPKPVTHFCIAIKETEAWFLGDITAIQSEYRILKPLAYKDELVYGTWERLADAIYPGGSVALNAKGYSEVGKTKSEWAQKITPHMNPELNQSPSFLHFYNTVKTLAGR
ncbi:MAG: hypothetical protein V4543_06345 [Bacteroidota bacterium]